MQNKIRRYNLYALLCLLVSLGWIWLTKVPPGSSAYAAQPIPRKSFAAPDFILPAPDGAVYNLQDLRGRPVIINFWASWCPPCRAEMPALERVYAEYQEEGLIVLAVNTTNQDDLQAALDLATSLNLTFPILLDELGDVSSLYQLQAMPTTFFVDAQGIIQDVVVGGPMAEALLMIRAEQLTGEVR
jgi:cytochrome c biogenesis protein CcmG/thiol:disulfide interchange protein DsbE